MIKILLDTNIFIYLEDNKVIEEKILQLTKRLYDSNEYKIVIHPKTKYEIRKMKDTEQKKIFESKIAVYKEIVNPPIANEEFHKLVGCKNEHDKIDNELLFSLKQNCASYLITNDKKMIKKSKIINLDDRILSIDKALDLFKPIEEYLVKKPSFIEEKYLYQLDIADPFFNSLREDYNGFDDWFKKKQIKEEKAFVVMEDNKLLAFLMLKEEDETETFEDFEQKLIPARRLKVATLKVADTGKKIGETFIKIMMQKALSLNVEEIYITVFDKQAHLIDLLVEYGFKYYCKKKTKKANGKIEYENVYIKSAKPIYESYPFIDLKNKKIFIVPIREKYHNILFSDSEKNVQLSLEDIKGLNTASNCLKKAYLCDSKIKQIMPGSILLFYSSGTKKAITSLGIVDVVFNNFESFDEMYSVVKKRTVYDKEELRKGYKKNKLVILFKHYYSFEKYVTYDYLFSNQIVKGNIQTIMHIENNDLQKILQECQIQKEKYFI